MLGQEVEVAWSWQHGAEQGKLLGPLLSGRKQSLLDPPMGRVWRLWVGTVLVKVGEVPALHITGWGPVQGAWGIVGKGCVSPLPLFPVYPTEE